VHVPHVIGQQNVHVTRGNIHSWIYFDLARSGVHSRYGERVYMSHVIGRQNMCATHDRAAECVCHL